MKHILAGYVIDSELKNLTAEDAAALDIINIAFAHCVDSKISFPHEDKLSELERIRGFNPDIKILVSVGGWGSGGFSPMCMTKKGRESFARSCLEFAQKHGLDGIDIDWEYPCLSWADIEADPLDKFNYTLMLEEIRNTFNTAGREDLMLTVAVGNDSYFIDNTEMDKVARVLDYVSIMTYDMRGCSDTLTGHHTNTYIYGDMLTRRGKRSAQHSVKIYHEAGVPLEKIVIGGAFYSRMWKNVTASDDRSDGLNCTADPGGYGPSYSELSESYIGKDGYNYYYDSAAGASYIFDGSTFISFDDENSLKAKCDFVKQQEILGIMYWEHSCDSSRKLLKAIRKNL